MSALQGYGCAQCCWQAQALEKDDEQLDEQAEESADQELQSLRQKIVQVCMH